MPITFLDKQGVIHKECVREGQRVNNAICVEVIGRLLKLISQMRPQFRAERSWFLLPDSAPSHSALVVKIHVFLARHSIVEISNKPYSPDLAPADFFFFPRWKLPSKERGFRMLKTLKKCDGRTERCSLGGLCWLFSKPFWTMQQMYSSSGDYF
jgi:hypothetical protein